MCLLSAAAVSFVLLLFLNVRTKDRRLRQAKRDVRMRLFSHVLRINFAEGVRFMGPAEQEAEYEAWVGSGDAGTVASVKHDLPMTPYPGEEQQRGLRARVLDCVLSVCALTTSALHNKS